MRTPIYPEIEISNEGNAVFCRTAFRKEQDGKYYLWYFSQWAYINNNYDSMLKDCLEKLHIDVYFETNTTHMDVNLKEGEQYYYPLDPDQTPESERLLNKIKI